MYEKLIKKEIDRVFELQLKNKWIVRKSSSRERIKKLKMIEKYIYEHLEEIQVAIYKDFNKPAEEVLLTEIYPVISGIKHTIKNINKWMKDKKVRTPINSFGAKCRIRHESRGISLIISPWNFPFLLAIEPFVSAVAAGNCVMIKPSEYSPFTTNFIKKMISEIFSENEAIVFEGDHKVSQILLNKPFDNIFFTGSPQVGKIVMEEAAKNLTSVTLELGGKSPVIIDSSADLDEAARRVAWGKCLNAGQICVAPDYLLIPEDKKEEFISLMIKYITRYYGNFEKCEKDIKYCSIINEKHFERIKNLVDEAVFKGAKIRFGGYYDEAERRISPTILTDIKPGSSILEEEIFGPVLPVISYRNIDEALEYIKSKPKPLVTYVFGRNNRNIDYILDNTESGDCVVNDVVVHFANVNLPFGGINNSGIGKSHGYHGFMAFTHERAYMKQAKISAISILYPPFTDKTKKLINFLMKYF